MSTIHGGILTARTLKHMGVDRVYGLVGYLVSPLFAGFCKENVKIYDVRHEQAAVHMADGYANITGKPGVAVVVGGPGFTNAITGIIKAYLSHTPLVLITGAMEPKKKDMGGLQDMDQLSLVRQYTKWSGTVYDVKRIPEYLANAFRQAVSGRRGPVVIEIPINLLREEVDEADIVMPESGRGGAKLYGDEGNILQAIDLLARSERPILIAGNGVFYAKAGDALKEFVELTGIPAFTVNAGRGTLPDDHELCFGQGRVLEAGPQLYAFKNADAVLILGTSLDYSLFFGKPPAFGSSQKCIQVDVDPAEIGRSGRAVDVAIAGHSDVILKKLTDAAQRSGLRGNYATWVVALREAEKKYWDEIEGTIDLDQKPIHPIRLLKDIQSVISRDTIIVRDGSNALMWAGLFAKSFRAGYNMVGPSGTFGPMGAGLPLALGAKTASPDSSVLLYTGDGSFGFNAIEIDTAVRHNLPIVIVVHNDGSWGFCRDTQKVIFADGGSGYGTELGVTRYDKLVASLGGYGEFIENPADIIPALKRAREANTVACLNVAVDGVMSPGSKLLNESVRILK